MFQKIKKEYEHRFNAGKAGLYLIALNANCKSGRILGFRGGEDLRVELDGLKLREIPPQGKPQYYNIPPAWNGTELKGLIKTVILVVQLKKGKHLLKFITNKGAILEKKPEVTRIDNPKAILKVIENLKTKERNRQSWATIALIDLPLHFMDVSVTCEKRFLDSDDVKLIIDGKIKKNEKSKIWGKNWHWQGRQLKGKPQTERFNLNFRKGIHYIEFFADRKPVLTFVKLNLGDVELLEGNEKEGLGEKTKLNLKRIPTINDPKWTGNFKDDSEELLMARLIFGEARDQMDEVKLWIGWSVVNRIEANSWWGDTIHGVILKEGQYDPFKGEDDNFKKIIDPLNFGKVKAIDKKSWYECYQIAENVVNRKGKNPTRATHFNGRGIDKDWFLENIIPKGKFIQKIDDTCFYWSPN